MAASPAPSNLAGTAENLSAPADLAEFLPENLDLRLS